MRNEWIHGKMAVTSIRNAVKWWMHGIHYPADSIRSANAKCWPTVFDAGPALSMYWWTDLHAYFIRFKPKIKQIHN